MSARPPSTCPTCGSAVVWPCVSKPCIDMTAPDSWHQMPRDDSTALWGDPQTTHRRVVRRMDITENRA